MGLRDSSKCAGPGTRQNIDEFTTTTSEGIVRIGGAEQGKAIIILNPAEPPIMMRDTVYCKVDVMDQEAILASIQETAERVRTYVPGYRLRIEQRVRVATFPRRVYRCKRPFP